MAVNNNEPSEEREFTLKFEAEHIVREVGYAVDDIQLSPSLPPTEDSVYLNVTTKEKERFCVELSSKGFKVVGKEYENVDDLCSKDNQYFETVYSLLDKVSPKYRECFGNALSKKLESLQSQDSDDEDS